MAIIQIQGGCDESVTPESLSVKTEQIDHTPEHKEPRKSAGGYSHAPHPLRVEFMGTKPVSNVNTASHLDHLIATDQAILSVDLSCDP